MKSFVQGAHWPLDRGSLTALSDMGITAEQIAQYFLIDPSEVRGLLDWSAIVPRVDRAP